LYDDDDDADLQAVWLPVSLTVQSHQVSSKLQTPGHPHVLAALQNNGRSCPASSIRECGFRTQLPRRVAQTLKTTLQS